MASWFGASIHFSGSPTSLPPGGLGMTGAVVGVPASLGAVAPSLGDALSVGEAVGEAVG
jgi:hypothetical protein